MEASIKVKHHLIDFKLSLVSRLLATSNQPGESVLH